MRRSLCLVAIWPLVSPRLAARTLWPHHPSPTYIPLGTHRCSPDARRHHRAILFPSLTHPPPRSPINNAFSPFLEVVAIETQIISTQFSTKHRWMGKYRIISRYVFGLFHGNLEHEFFVCSRILYSAYLGFCLPDDNANDWMRHNQTDLMKITILWHQDPLSLSDDFSHFRKKCENIRRCKTKSKKKYGVIWRKK